MRSTIGEHFRRIGARIGAGAVIGLMVGVGCHDSASPELSGFESLRIEPTPSRLAPGDTARLLFRNMGGTDVYANACGSRLERETRTNEWEDVALPTGPNCADTYRVIHPGSEFIDIVGLTPASLQAGRYRYRVATIGRPSPTGAPEIFRFAVTSESFVIE